MEITSVVFFAFVGASLLVYWKLPARLQWMLLLADSLLFYILNTEPVTLLYLAASLLSVYGATRFFGSERAKAAPGLKKGAVCLTVAINVGILAVLKYTNLGIGTINAIGTHVDGFESLAEVNWLAPLAISYYTLQIVAYLLDCYWGTAVPEKNFAKLVLFVCYFPQMVSGPICRYSQTGEELFREHRFDYVRVTRGMKRIAWGLMKKLVVADRVALAVDYMFANPGTFDGVLVWAAVFGFVLELYMDFSGCMDIVLGVSACFGIALPENFNAPFFSRTVQEFWQRFHITLGTWLRDYIMNPILKSEFCYRMGERSKKLFGKKRGKRIPVYFAMFFLWSAMGLWHGNSWKYICGEGWWFWLVIVLGQLLESVFVRVRKLLHIKAGRLWQIFQVVRTFLIYSVGILFFRAESLPVSFRLIGSSFHMPDFRAALRDLYSAQWSKMGGTAGIVVCCLAVLAVCVADLWKYRGIDAGEKISALPAAVRWGGYYLLVFLIAAFGMFGQSKFIYFQF